MWRLRMVLRLLLLYFLWEAFFVGSTQVFGYTKVEIITYILISEIVGSLVFSSRTQDIATDIHQGNLTNILVKPIHYISYIIGKDIADKFLNTVFSFIEVTVLLILLRPGILYQQNLTTLSLFLLASGIAIVLYFFISIIVSLTSFWSQESWAPRFIFMIISEFLSGGLFPLNILPKPIFSILSIFPTTYLLYFPAKIYLGKMTQSEILGGISTSIIWIGILAYLSWVIWKRGLRVYSAQGH